MAADGPILVTRPAGQVDALIATLETAGFEAWHLPLLSIETIDPLPGSQRQHVLDLDLYQHLIFVSANAARIGLERIGDYWPQMPMGQHYWAVGASTARVMETAGLAVQRPESDMSSEGLLAMKGLQHVDGERVLIVRGEGGRRLIADTLTERGARVDSLCCYRRSPVTHDGAALRRRMDEQLPAAIMVSSGEGLEHLYGLLQPQEHTTLARIALLVPSPRVADDARQQGWLQVVQAQNATDEAMLAALMHWRDANPGRDSIE